MSKFNVTFSCQDLRTLTVEADTKEEAEEQIKLICKMAKIDFIGIKEISLLSLPLSVDDIVYFSTNLGMSSEWIRNVIDMLYHTTFLMTYEEGCIYERNMPLDSICYKLFDRKDMLAAIAQFYASGDYHKTIKGKRNAKVKIVLEESYQRL